MSELMDISASSGYNNSIPKDQIFAHHIATCFLSKDSYIYMEALMKEKEMKPVVIKNMRLQSGFYQNCWPFYSFAVYQGSDVMRKKEKNSKPNHLWNCKAFDWDFLRINESCSYGELWAWKMGYINNKSNSWSFLNIRIPTTGSKSISFRSINSPHGKAFNSDIDKNKEHVII